MRQYHRMICRLQHALRSQANPQVKALSRTAIVSIPEPVGSLTISRPLSDSKIHRRFTDFAWPMFHLQWISNQIKSAPFFKILHERREVGERSKIIVPKYHQVPDRPSEGLVGDFTSLSDNEPGTQSGNARHTSTVSFN